MWIIHLFKFLIEDAAACMNVNYAVSIFIFMYESLLCLKVKTENHL
jgi:hypothetical protein